jgi:hypothetical protein
VGGSGRPLCTSAAVPGLRVRRLAEHEPRRRDPPERVGTYRDPAPPREAGHGRGTYGALRAQPRVPVRAHSQRRTGRDPDKRAVGLFGTMNSASNAAIGRIGTVAGSGSARPAGSCYPMACSCRRTRHGFGATAGMRLAPSNRMRSLTSPRFETRANRSWPADPRAQARGDIANGAPIAVLIDPYERAVEVYRPGCEPEIHRDAATVAFNPELRGFAMEPGLLFAE